MSDYIFDEWKSLLETFQNSVKKDLDEIHRQKVEVQQMKIEVFEQLAGGQYFRDDNRIVISAPEIIIGNVAKSGDLLDGTGRVIIKANQIGMEGAGSSGSIVSRAPSIRQVAVDPGIDGVENVVCNTSEIVSQATSIILNSNNAEGTFSQLPASPVRGGIIIHADTHVQLEAAATSKQRKADIEATIKALTTQIQDLDKAMTSQKTAIEKCFKDMQDYYDKTDKILTGDNYMSRVDITDVEELNEDLTGLTSTLYSATAQFIHTISLAAEANRKKKALETEKDAIKTGDEFKDNTTGASMNIIAETINMATKDGDGNLHVNSGAGISIRTPKVDVSMMNDKGVLTKDSFFKVHAQDVDFTTYAPSSDGKQYPNVGHVSILSKDINLEAVDYQFADDKVKEKALTADGKVSITAKTVEVATTSPTNIDRDKEGKLTKGEYKAEGDVIIRSKTINMETLDYEVADGKLKTKTLTQGSGINMRSEKIAVVAADAEGKATGSISLNAKAVAVKSMDVDKESLADKSLAAGSTMTVVSEKMFVGAKSKSVKSKKVQVLSEEVGLFADNTLESQQGDGKAVLQLAGGNAAISGSKTQVYGKTTINADTEVKGAVKAPSGEFDSVKAKSAFKSPNISDGMGVSAGGGGGSLSAKLKTEDAPAEK